MSIGAQIKRLRTEQGMSQPQLAELAGIEQSYLSKLENDKSIPSNDIFRQILTALSLKLDDFIKHFNLDQDRAQLMQIPDIEHWFKQHEQKHAQAQRRYLYICSALVVIAVTQFYIGYDKRVFNEQRFQYDSVGVVLPGEPPGIFRDWPRLIEAQGDMGHLAREEKAREMTRREDKVIFLTRENRGDFFAMPVDGGTRYFQKRKDERVPRLINAWLKVFGVMFFTAGIMGFLLERRLFKK